jgi:hypothetical protein
MGPFCKLVVIDWAMKWLAFFFREKQEQFYGKAGLSWHQAVAIDNNGICTGFVHLAEEAKQDAAQV